MSRERPPVKLIHTSDVHLDARRRREHGPERTPAQRAFERVVDLVCEESADLFLIAGDLFDSNRVGVADFEFACAQLSRASCPVVVIPGNHDCYDDGSVYRAFDLREAGSHVHPLTAEDGEMLEFAELHATVWGRGLVEHDPSYQPLAGVPPRRGDLWHVGMAHGYFVEEDVELRSSLIRPEEVASSGLDYLALGHVHVFRDVSRGDTRACYPGTPGPLYLGAEGPGSAAVVTLDPDAGIEIEQRKLEV